MSQTLVLQTRDPNQGPNNYRLRKSGWIPGVIYGTEFGSISVQVEDLKLKKCLKMGESIFTVSIDNKRSALASVQELQTSVLDGKIVHVAFHAHKKGEKTELTIPLEFVGTAPGVKEGGNVLHVLHEVKIRCLPSDSPNTIVVDLSNLHVNEHMTFEDVVLPKNVELVDVELTETVATCHKQKVVKEPEPTVEVAEGAVAADAAKSAKADDKKDD